MKKLRLLKIGNKLRLLKIGNMQLQKHLIGGNVELPQGLIYLSNELRALEWHGYPLKSLPNNFQPNELVGTQNALQLHQTIVVRNYGKIFTYANVYFYLLKA